VFYCHTTSAEVFFYVFLCSFVCFFVFRVAPLVREHHPITIETPSLASFFESAFIMEIRLDNAIVFIYCINS
jgi:hypothetical protein